MTSLKQYPTAAIRVDNVGFFCSKCVSWQGFSEDTTFTYVLPHLQCNSSMSSYVMQLKFIAPFAIPIYCSICSASQTYPSKCKAIHICLLPNGIHIYPRICNAIHTSRIAPHAMQFKCIVPKPVEFKALLATHMSIM